MLQAHKRTEALTFNGLKGDLYLISVAGHRTIHADGITNAKFNLSHGADEAATLGSDTRLRGTDTPLLCLLTESVMLHFFMAHY